MRKLPWYSPPHFGEEGATYLLSAACWNHQPILNTPERRDEWLGVLLGIEDALDADLRAWVVLPNHYHLLVCVPLPAFKTWIKRWHNGKAAQWNREDKTPGRAVWYRFRDDAIRSERNYYSAINYIHANPVKHGYVQKSQDWKWSSSNEYEKKIGLGTLRNWWREHPCDDFGKDWDE